MAGAGSDLDGRRMRGRDVGVVVAFAERERQGGEGGQAFQRTSPPIENLATSSVEYIIIGAHAALEAMRRIVVVSTIDGGIATIHVAAMKPRLVVATVVVSARGGRHRVVVEGDAIMRMVQTTQGGGGGEVARPAVGNDRRRESSPSVAAARNASEVGQECREEEE